MTPKKQDTHQKQRPCRVNRDVLRQVPLFHDLTDRDLDRVAHAATCHWYSRWAKIAYPHEEPNIIFLVASGYARLHDTSPEGEELTLALLDEGQICGAPLVALVAGSNALLQAVTKQTLIYRILWDLVVQLRAAYPEVGAEAHKVTLERLAGAYAWMESTRFEPVPARVEHTVKRIAERNPNNEVPLTRAVIAAVVGTSREEASRAITELAHRELVVAQARGKLFVPNPSKLR